MEKYDHCRIGSLEIIYSLCQLFCMDHCRIGSLEIPGELTGGKPIRSLPHRQLRKQAIDKGKGHIGSLPHRQLRNDAFARFILGA